MNGKIGYLLSPSRSMRDCFDWKVYEDSPSLGVRVYLREGTCRGNKTDAMVQVRKAMKAAEYGQGCDENGLDAGER